MIRLVTEQDIPSLLKIEEKCFEFDRFDRKRFLYFLSKESKNLFYVYEHESEIIAYILTTFKQSSSEARIYSIAVFPEHQEKKIGHHLLNFTEKLIIQKEKRAITCEVRIDNKASKSFFTSNGYEKFALSKNYYEDGCDAYLYRKLLS
jgi:ribosomal protein S18 acetylase RimI-like enzyme